MKKPKARPRKPRDLIIRGLGFATFIGADVVLYHSPDTAAEARKLAQWLIKAADYLDAKRGK